MADEGRAALLVCRGCPWCTPRHGAVPRGGSPEVHGCSRSCSGGSWQPRVSQSQGHAGTSWGWGRGGSPHATGCCLLRGAPPAPALFLPLLQPKPHCQDPQVPSSPIPRSPGGSGCRLAPMSSVTPFCVTHVPAIRSAVENCHNKYAVNLGRLSAIISPEPEGRETACCNTL